MESESLVHCPVGEFLDRLASPAPTPGGGSVAALIGALAAGLGRMVVALTVGKPKFAAVEVEVRALDERLRRAGEMLRRLVDEDAAAYGMLSEALSRDRADPQRPERIRQAAGLAATVPLETATLCARMLADLEKLCGIGNPQLRSDAEAAGHLAKAALQAAAANVRANLPLMRAEDAQAVEKQLDALQ